MVSEQAKSWLKENWFKIGLLAVLAIFVAYAFYWFQVRPSLIKKKCHAISVEKARSLLKTKSELSGGYQYKEWVEKGLSLKDDRESAYQNCLREKGL